MSSIDRKAHCLIKGKTLSIPRHVIIFDTETTSTDLPNGETKQELKLGWAVYRRSAHGRHLAVENWHFFTTAESFWHFVESVITPKQRLWIIARNMPFDFTIVKGWHFLRRAGYKLKFFHNAGLTTIITVQKSNASIVFIDSLNWFRESLAKTGERIGIPKLKIDFDTCTDSFLSTYCKRDVEIELANFKLFVKFLHGNHISRLTYTIGSTAMAAYLLNHYHKTIYIHNNKEALDLERASYRGGRVECFYIGELNDGKYHVLDVNSLYPFVMRNNLYPCKYKEISHKVTPSILRQLLQTFSVIAKVLIDTPFPAYAVKRERTIFPIGRFWVSLTTPELKFALDNSHILKIDWAVIYHQAPLFKTYVDKFYALRQDFKSAGVSEYEEICKLLLNSLYGKFGQKADIWEKIGLCPDEPDRVEVCYKAGSNRPYKIRYLLGEIFESTGTVEAFNSFPAISSHVTAYARMYFYQIMNIAKTPNYFYCDTDSLIVNETGFSNLYPLLNKTKLGYLKLEESTSFVNIRGLKDYSTASKTVLKGIRKSAVQVSPMVYSQERWPSFKGLLRSLDVNTYTISTITKTLSRIYTKGTVLSSGFVRPFVLSESDLPF